MLDVHAPEHRLTGTRDFFVHLFTITIGLLIALGLENAVEALHHRHERKEAEASIREELSHNRDLLRKGGPVVKAEAKDLLQAIALMKGAKQGQSLNGKSFNLQFSDETLDDGAWRTAMGTGALAYMDYSEVERFADAYKEQGLLEEAEHKAIGAYVQFTPTLSLLKGDLSAEDINAILPVAQQALGHVAEVLAFAQGTADAYDKALQR